MTIKEMHIGLDQGVQHLASNRSRAFHPEEKDFILNKVVNRYITSRLRPRGDGSYEVDSLAQEQLKTLIVQAPSIPAEITGTGEYIVRLPSNLGWYITAQAHVQDRFCLSTQAITKTLTRYIHTLKFPLSNKTVAKYYEIAELATATIANIALANSATWTGLSSKEQVFEVMRYLVEELRKTLDVVNLYANTLQILGTNATPLTAKSDGQTVSSTVVTEIYPVYDPAYATTNAAPIRLIPTVQKFELQQTPFWKSTPQSLLACFVDNSLRIVEPTSSIVTTSDIIYVKKPRQLSLSLNQNSDLPEDYHGDIVDLAVAYIKLELNRPDWEKTLADNKLNTTI